LDTFFNIIHLLNLTYNNLTNTVPIFQIIVNIHYIFVVIRSPRCQNLKVKGVYGMDSVVLF
jgi:hypothetical protein